MGTTLVTSAGHEQDEPGVVAAIDGEAGEFGTGDGAAHRGFLRLKDGGGSGNLDGFGDLADFEGEIDLHDGGDFEDDFREDFRLEAGHGGRDFVFSRVEGEDAEGAVAVGFDGADDSGSFVFDVYSRPCDHADLRIDNGSDEGGIGCLRRQSAGDERE